MKPLLSVMRESNRYVVFNLKNKTTYPTIKETITSTLTQQIGELGLASSNLKIIENKFNGRRGIIKIAPTHTNQLIFALSLNKDPRFTILGISGILKKTKRFK
ncbi:hypothetical protein CL622_00770 [archaeon]|nr:hypothetical protein [archaeon]